MSKYESELDCNYLTAELDEKKKLKSGTLEWYKGEKGRTDRLALIYFQDVVTTLVDKARKGGLSGAELDAKVDAQLAELAKRAGKSVEDYRDSDPLDYDRVGFRVCTAGYVEGKGFFEIPRSYPASEKDIWAHLGEPREYISVLAIRYQTDKTGNLLDKTNPSYEVMPWRFGVRVWEQLAAINEGLQESGSSIAHQDLRITCDDTKYQKLTITAAGPNAWRKNDALKAAVQQDAQRLRHKIKPFRIVTAAELAQALGLDDISDSEAANVLATL